MKILLLTPYLIEDVVNFLDVDRGDVICGQGVGFSLQVFIDFLVLMLL